MSETVLEQSEKLDGTIVQLVRLDDGQEVKREFRYYCQTCHGEGWMSADCMPPGEKCIDCNGTGCEGKPLL